MAEAARHPEEFSVEFRSLRESLERRSEQLRVDRIIREEVDHVLMLTTALGISRPAEA